MADDYVYQVLKKYRKNGNSLPTEKVRGRKVGEGRRLPQATSDEIIADSLNSDNATTMRKPAATVSLFN